LVDVIEIDANLKKRVRGVWKELLKGKKLMEL
jgi:hypothetical protein